MDDGLVGDRVGRIGCSTGCSRSCRAQEDFLVRSAPNLSLGSYFFEATVLRVTGANVDHFVVNTEVVPQVDAVLEQPFVKRPESSGFEMMICSPRTDALADTEVAWPWLPTSRRKHCDTPIREAASALRGWFRPCKAVSGC